jgi:hypothetical protein
MPSPAPEPLAPRPLSVWLVDPCEDIPGEGFPPGRCWSLARILTSRGHDVTWWSGTWSHRRQATRSVPAGIHEDEGFAVRLVAARPFTTPASLARLRSERDFARTLERLASEAVAAGHLDRPDLIIASLPPLESTEAAARLARRVDATFVVDARDVWPEAERRQLPGPAFIRPLLAALLVGNLGSRQAAILAACDGVAATSRTALDAFAGGGDAGLPRSMCPVGGYTQEFAIPRRHVDPVPFAGTDPAAAAPRSPACVCPVDDEDDATFAAAVARGLVASGVPVTLHIVPRGGSDRPLRLPGVEGMRQVVLHDRLSRSGYVGLLADCDIGLVLTRKAAAPVIPEAACDFAAAGLAIVHDAPGELADLVAGHDAGVRFDPGDVGGAVRELAGLAADRRRLLAFQDAARRLALAALDRERLYTRFVDWLETLST